MTAVNLTTHENATVLEERLPSEGPWLRGPTSAGQFAERDPETGAWCCRHFNWECQQNEYATRYRTTMVHLVQQWRIPYSASTANAAEMLVTGFTTNYLSAAISTIPVAGPVVGLAFSDAVTILTALEERIDVSFGTPTPTGNATATIFPIETGWVNNRRRNCRHRFGHTTPGYCETRFPPQVREEIDALNGPFSSRSSAEMEIEIIESDN